MQKLHRTGLTIAERVGIWSAIAWSLAVLVALGARSSLALGLAAGGGITLAFFALHLALARHWIAQSPRRSARIYLWFVWIVKWPACAALLYLLVASGLADPVWLCLGAAIIPLVATAFALVMLAFGAARRPMLDGAS